MQQRKLALANLAGTTLMTLFSEAVSYLAKKDLSEPVLLSKFLEHSPISLPQKQARPIAWISHYVVGQAFATAYGLALKQLDAKPAAKNGLLMGVLSGLTGVGIWKATFKLHPNPPKPPAAQFYTQLLLAHVVFGLVADGVLQLLDKQKHEDSKPLVAVEQAADTYYPLQDENAVVSPS
ncbi:hypothetical protein [Mucilaginibacter lacusdianchii]|uniref:hypothetical protein n=1 Tax=Mucilaginibacter lacusdianchii TaxID=2684211 RepID=UPI00131CB31A|nr:hypothetical protein [Mucilaginibacter sp. JXJ CY 39]